MKIKISDYFNAAVPDASAFLFYALGTPSVVGTAAEPVGNSTPDSGNAMRYDAADNQYIFNWDVSLLPNGTYTARVGLGEGTCAPAHTVTLSLDKKTE